MTPPVRVVLDTVVFVQTLISNRGPAAECVRRAMAGDFVLLLSQPLIDEIAGVPLRPELTRRYSHLTPSRVEGFVDAVMKLALVMPTPARAFALPRDPKDEPLIDLAVAGKAGFIVTWNERHLTYLMRRDTPERVDFCERYPAIRIVPPTQFLLELDALAPKTS